MRQYLHLFIFILIASQSYGQSVQCEFSIKIKNEFKDDFNDSAFQVSLVGNLFIKSFTIRKDQHIFLDSIPTNGVSAFVDYMKVYDSLDVIKNFNGYQQSQIPQNNKIKIVFVFPPECEFTKNVKNNICTKCHRNNMVVPIVYDAAFSKNFYSSRPQVETFSGGSVDLSDCSKTWHCKRDHFEF